MRTLVSVFVLAASLIPAFLGLTSPAAWAKVDGDLGLLDQIRIARDANRAKVLTWEGEARIETHQLEKGAVDDRTSKVVFAYDRPQAAWVFDWTWVKTPKAGLDGWHVGGMLKDKAWYSYMPHQPGGKVLQIVAIRNGPERVGPMTERFDPMYYFAGDGRDMRSQFDFWRKISTNDLLRLSIKRDGPLVTITDSGVKNPNIVWRYIYDLSKGGNALSIVGRDDTGEERWEFTWENSSGPWVPKTASYQNATHDKSNVIKKIVTWERSIVNKPIESDKFSLEAMGVFPGAKIQDQRRRPKAPIP